jgi:hypothetical protein
MSCQDLKSTGINHMDRDSQITDGRELSWSHHRNRIAAVVRSKTKHQVQIAPVSDRAHLGAASKQVLNHE